METLEEPMKLFRRITLILAVALFAAACAAPKSVSPTPNPTSVPTDAGATGEASGPFAFSATTLAGDPVDETLFTDNSLTMVNVWATFCGYCIREMPDIEQLSKDYADRGFSVVGIVGDVAASGVLSDREKATVDSLIDQTGTTYTQLLPGNDVYHMFFQRLRAYPTTFFVDSTGSIVSGPHEGARDYNGWKALIEELLPEQDASAAPAMAEEGAADPATLFEDFQTTDLSGNPVDSNTLYDADMTLLVVWNPEEPEDAKSAFALVDEYIKKKGSGYATMPIYGMPTKVTDPEDPDFRALADSAGFAQLMPTEATSSYFQNDLTEFYMIAPWGTVLDGPMAADSNVNTVKLLVSETFEALYLSGCCG